MYGCGDGSDLLPSGTGAVSALVGAPALAADGRGVDDGSFRLSLDALKGAASGDCSLLGSAVDVDAVSLASFLARFLLF